MKNTHVYRKIETSTSVLKGPSYCSEMWQKPAQCLTFQENNPNTILLIFAIMASNRNITYIY